MNDTGRFHVEDCAAIKLSELRRLGWLKDGRHSDTYIIPGNKFEPILITTEVTGDTGTIQIGEQRWPLECYHHRSRYGSSTTWLVKGASGHREPTLLVLPTGTITTRKDAGIIYKSQDRLVSREQYLKDKERREQEQQRRHREAHGQLRRWHAVTLTRLQHRLANIQQAILDPLYRFKAFTGPRFRRWFRNPAAKVFVPKVAHVDPLAEPEFSAPDPKLKNKLMVLVGVSGNPEAGELDPRDRDVPDGCICRIIGPVTPDVASHLYTQLAEDGRYIVRTCEPEIGSLIDRKDPITFVLDMQEARKSEREDKLRHGELVDFVAWRDRGG
jgi:hypothetical protein